MTGKMGLYGLLFLGVFIFGNFFIQLTSAPSRTQTARLEPLGELNIHLETQPDPPKTGGIPLILHITDQNGKAMAVDKAHYEYAFNGRGATEVDGESIGLGVYKVIAALTDVGEWQVRVTLSFGTKQTQVRFTVRVMPNI